MTTLVNGGRQRIPLDRIAIGDNVRELDADHVDALAASIKLRGLVVPVIVRAAGDDYELVAGYHRVAAHKKLGEANIDAEIRDVDTEHADRAIENVARKQLNPYEEAQAVRAMLADGRLTEDGAAQALGWSRARVTARIKLLELPERAQQLVGAGTIPLSAVDQLRAIGQVSPELLEAVIDFLADGNEWAAERLTRE
ncbi:MAG: ParB/RepB/Spo0J family partition protein, partial [Solirubrobacteraceae bacterium]